MKRYHALVFSMEEEEGVDLVSEALLLGTEFETEFCVIRNVFGRDKC